MTPERWQHVKEVFTYASALDATARERYLADICGDDAELRAQVERLLSAHDRRDAILDFPAGHYLPADSLQPAEDAWIGKIVGAYELTACIGKGGMGTVYRARRADAQYEKEVAVKLVRAGLGSELVLQRFRAERQILAHLDHPNIARLLDGGVTASGEPFLVLELVNGEPIDVYCNRHDLPVAERLRLFRDTCEAVSYAHRHLVVHRDLKPANILVTAEGSIKLLDFGIAKLLQPAQEDGTEIEATRTTLRAMTPAFSSPEQILGLPITTASDVYSLGVVLFHLLAGRSPYRTTLDSTQDAIRDVCETEPLKPSAAAALMRSTGTRALQPDRELDDITLRALRKEPEKRYSSVAELSEDVRRHLAGLPVIARGDRLTYRAGKFWRRHRFSLTAAGLVAVALLAGLLITLREARIAEEQRALAAQNFESVRGLANTFIFQVHDAIKDLPGATPARDLLVSTALRYLDTLSRQPSPDRAFQRELAAAYARLGDVQGQPNSQNSGHDKAALGSYSKALSLYEALARADPNDTTVLSETANTHVSRSRVLMMVNGDPRGAAKDSQVGIDLSEKVAAIRRDDPAAAEALARAYDVHSYQESILGDHDAARDSADKAVAVLEALSRQRPEDQNIHTHLFDAYHARLQVFPRSTATASEVEGSLELARKIMAFDEQRRSDSGNDLLYWRSIAIDWNTTGIWTALKGDYAAAVDAFQKAAAGMEKTMADAQNAQAQLDYGRLRMNLARMQVAAGRLDEARQELLTNRRLFETILQRTDTYEIQYFIAASDEELGTVELQRALAAKDPKQQLQAWRSAHDWFARAVPRFQPILKVASFDIWDGAPPARAVAGLTRSTAEIQRLEQTATASRP